MGGGALARDARSLLQVVYREPRRAVPRAARVLRTAQARGDYEAAAVAERALGLAAMHLGRVDTAVTHLENAVQCAVEGGLREVAAETRMTLAFTLARRGETESALDTVTMALS